MIDPKRLKKLYALSDNEKYIDTLNKIISLMVETHKEEGWLKGSSMTIEYRHNRLLLKAFVDKRI